jgi:hypothetical protein
VLFREETHYYPGGEWNKEVAKAVGEDLDSLSLWQKICHDWVGLGWSPRNVKGMLESFRKGGIESRQRRRVEKVADPQAYAASAAAHNAASLAARRQDADG